MNDHLVSGLTKFGVSYFMKRLQNIFLYTSSLTFYMARRKVVMKEVISPLINMIAVGLRPSSMAKV